MFTLNDNDLLFLARQNAFPLPKDEMIFVGLRGVLPVAADNQVVKLAHALEIRPINHVHLRCTLIQWEPGKGFAAFPGSTVPSQRNVKAAASADGEGANMQLTGFFRGYGKGVHRQGTPTGHEAFRNAGILPVRRTADPNGYGADDRVDTGSTPFNNIHAAWAMSVNNAGFSSAGCQVIEGYPKCERRNGEPDTGAWKIFRARAYARSQRAFSYMLLSGTDGARRAANRRVRQAMRLRYGSRGDAVAALQTALTMKGLYGGTIDGGFGMGTLKAVLAFQVLTFGEDSDDGIVGPQTATALGLDLPLA